MDVREKLVELLKKAKAKEQYDFLFGDIDTAIDMPHGAEYYADYLIAHGVTVQEWISVKDRLPDKHDRYLCNVKAFSFPDLRYFAILKYDDGGFIEGKIYTDDVTHWMPLPQPPKGE